MTEEVKLPKTEAEYRQKLEIALEGGRELGAREALSKAEQGSSEDQLIADFHVEAKALATGPRKNMMMFRQLQAKYVELGANIEDLDVNPPQPNWQGHRVGDGPPPPR